MLRIDADQPRWLPHDATRVDLTIVNLSILKNRRARAIRFSTLTVLCAALACQPDDVMYVATDGAPSKDNASQTPTG